jgi:acyl-coenzyme A synthetase/AMP-(fatty) acid ligase
VSLAQFRFLVASLFEQFQGKGIKRGDTVLLATLSSNNEDDIVILLVALMSYGVRVLFPMFVETSCLSTWFQTTDCSVVIIPGKEIEGLNAHMRQKKVIADIRTTSTQQGCRVFDVSDFTITVPQNNTTLSASQEKLVQDCLQKNKASMECAIFTTSGSSGQSKLVVYTQGAYLTMFESWQEAGMYARDKMGGRTFIDILPHTISVRAVLNALWTGQPVCLLNADWIKEKPQRILPLLKRMKPEVMTLGPSSYVFVLELIDLVPEVKALAFSELKTVISTGTIYSTNVADKIRDIFGLVLYNAYGTTETQQVTTTLLNDPDTLNDALGSIGQPLPGVTLGLQCFDTNTYRLFVRSPYGHARILNSENKKHTFFFTGDIVRQTSHGDLFYVGRESHDFVKSGYGAKIPVAQLKSSYHELYDKVAHIEYYPTETFRYAFGIAALIYITDDSLPLGRVLDSTTLAQYRRLILNINLHLIDVLEPFEFEQQLITRFLLVNTTHIDRTFKGTINQASLKTRFSKEINDLQSATNFTSGVQHLGRFNDRILELLIRHTPLRNSALQRLALTFVLKENLLRARHQ